MRVGAFIVAGAILALAASDVAAAKPPKVVELNYAEYHDPISARRLDVFVRRADAVSFKTRYEGQSAKARATYKSREAYGPYKGDAKHPWRARTNQRLKQLIHEALTERGRADIKVIMRNDQRRRVQEVVVLLSECYPHPTPTYPISCSVKP